LIEKIKLVSFEEKFPILMDFLKDFDIFFSEILINLIKDKEYNYNFEYNPYNSYSMNK
jgi:hypothetical protein